MVELKNIKFGYKKNKPLFNDLNLNLAPGYIYGLLGKNGAGKSTLLKHLSGLLFPDTGQCMVLGYDSRQRDPEMLEDIFVIPEEFELPSISLKSFTKTNAVFYSKFDQNQLEVYLNEFELDKDGKLSEFSFGQKKKFLIAFGLATNARLMILDEPTNGLDIPSKSQFRKTVASALNEDRSIIISTHQVRDLENLIDNVVVLEKGKIIFNKSIEAISERLRFEHNLRDASEGDLLYAEDMAGRKAGILRNLLEHESRVDLELLFNGVVKTPDLLNAQFKQYENEKY